MAYERRQYQVMAVQQCVEDFTVRGLKSIMLESPVGSGKTYMALEVIHQFQKVLGRSVRINWVAPRHHLLQQVMEANHALYQDDIRPVSLFERNPPETDFVVLDEAHHEATRTCVLLYEKMQNEWTLGLSATPIRTDRMKLSFQHTVKTCSISMLIEKGYLSPFNSYLTSEYNVEEIAASYLRDREYWGKSVVFFQTILECMEFKEALNKSGVRCEVITAESDKDRQIELFASGAVGVVANVAMLSEGFDQPDVRTIFARDASRLPTIQMCGRGLRKYADKSVCNIVQSINTQFPFERVAKPVKSYRFERGYWLALDDRTEQIEATVRCTLALMEKQLKKDKEDRKEDYLRARRHARKKFKKALR